MSCTIQVVELKPDWPKGYSRLGAAAIGLGETEKAKSAYEKGAQPQPTVASAWAPSHPPRCAFELQSIAQEPAKEEALQLYLSLSVPINLHRHFAGLEVDPANEGFKTELENLNRPPRSAGGGFFGPEVLGKLALNPQTAPLLSQPDFIHMIQDVNKNPNNMSKCVLSRI